MHPVHSTAMTEKHRMYSMKFKQSINLHLLFQVNVGGSQITNLPKLSLSFYRSEAMSCQWKLKCDNGSQFSEDSKRS